MQCNPPSSSVENEKFHLIPVQGDKVHLNSGKKKYCSAVDNENTVNCTKDEASENETFEKFVNADNTFSLKCRNGSYLKNPGNKQSLCCCGNEVNTDTKFKTGKCLFVSYGVLITLFL